MSTMLLMMLMMPAQAGRPDVGPSVALPEAAAETARLALEQARAERCPMPELTTEVWAGGTWEWIGRRPIEAPKLDKVPAHASTGDAPNGRYWRDAGPAVRVDACGDMWERVGAGHGESELLDPTVSLATPFDGPDRTEPDAFELPGQSELESWEDACGENGRDHAIYDSDDRTEITGFTYRAQRANVAVELFETYLTYGLSGWTTAVRPVGHCSGVMIQDDVVLTNAHCLAIQRSSDDVYYRERSPGHVVVCSKGNRDGTGAVCSSASDVIVNPAYLDTKGNVDQDFAIAVLENPIVGWRDTMGLSQDGPETWDNFRVRQMAYHGRKMGFHTWIDDWNFYAAPTCEWNDEPAENPAWTVYGTNQGLDGYALYRDTRPAGETNFSTSLVKTQTDGSKGSSGSPYFICPDEDCNLKPQIIGLHARYKWPGSHRRQGPRVDLFADFVEDCAP